MNEQKLWELIAEGVEVLRGFRCADYPATYAWRIKAEAALADSPQAPLLDMECCDDLQAALAERLKDVLELPEKWDKTDWCDHMANSGIHSCAAELRTALKALEAKKG